MGAMLSRPYEIVRGDYTEKGRESMLSPGVTGHVIVDTRITRPGQVEKHLVSRVGMLSWHVLHLVKWCRHDRATKAWHPKRACGGSYRDAKR